MQRHLSPAAHSSSRVAAALAFWVLAGCGLKNELKEDYPVPDYAETPLAGAVKGKTWTAAMGHVKRSTIGPSRISLSFKSNADDRGCDAIMRGLDDINVGITVSEQLGEQVLTGAASPASIAIGDEVFTIVGNKIDITTITETTVSGRLSMYSADDLFVNGTFSALRCY